MSVQRPDIELVGYEPIPSMLLQAKEETKEFKNIKLVSTTQVDNHFDCVTCFEVIEHLTTENQVRIFVDCKRLVNRDGSIILSVPIETGVSGLLKNITRWIVGQPHAKNWKEVMKAFLGIKLTRVEEDGFIYSHIGFRYQDVERLFVKENLEIKERIFSPLPWLGSVLNSQVFYVLKVL